MATKPVEQSLDAEDASANVFCTQEGAARTTVYGRFELVSGRGKYKCASGFLQYIGDVEDFVPEDSSSIFSVQLSNFYRVENWFSSEGELSASARVSGQITIPSSCN